MCIHLSGRHPDCFIGRCSYYNVDDQGFIPTPGRSPVGGVSGVALTRTLEIGDLFQLRYLFQRGVSIVALTRTPEFGALFPSRLL